MSRYTTSAPGMGGSSFYGGAFPPAVKWLLIANVGIFLAQFLFDGLFRVPFTGILAFYPPAAVSRGWLWQFATYMFLHGGITHLLFNMFALWMFGRGLEELWGTARFLRFYFACGIGAALVYAVILALFGQPGDPVIGASGAIYGLLLAYGLIWKDQIIYLNFFIPIKAKYFALILGVISFFSSAEQLAGRSSSSTAHLAHLGGLLVGMMFMWLDLDRWLTRLPAVPRFSRHPRPKMVRRRPAYKAAPSERRPHFDEDTWR